MQSFRRLLERCGRKVRELHRRHHSPATSEVIDRLMALVAG
jgi:hypothetical protein